MITSPLRPRRPALIIAGLAVFALSLAASSPRFFEAVTQADFLKGDLTDLAVDAQGRLSLGFATEAIYETASPFVWALAAGPGGAAYLGSGNDGRVFRVDATGQGSVLFDAAELEVHALAPGPDDSLFVGTSPQGRIYKVARDGTAATFFDPDATYIWALAVDRAGNLYAATGEGGVIYKIAPDGTGAPFYTTRTTHALALAFDGAGNLLVGTGSPGRVIRVDPQGKGFVLLDSSFEEIHMLRFDSAGQLYAAAINGGAQPASAAQPVPAPSTSSQGNQPVATVSTEVTAVVVADSSSTQAAPAASRDDRRLPKGALYRIAPNGLWDEIWESRDDTPYDVAFEPDGALLVATGNNGRIFRLDGDPLQPTLVARAPARQVTAFLRDAQGRLRYATANPGKLFSLASTRAATGTYESQPLDAETVSTWGAISWRGTIPAGSSVRIATRSGNTETPDDTWSDWSAAYADADGSPMSNPNARYLQWRAVLSGSGAGPVLTSVRAAYLQRNLRPTVRTVTVHPPGIVFQKPYSTGDPELAGFASQSTPDQRLNAEATGSNGGAGLGRRVYEKGLETITWRADDDNGDDLRYDILYRREGQTDWTALRRGVTDTILVWDTSTVPNGTYFVKVVASDAPSNAPAAALAGELSSAAFEVDNTPPAIAVGATRVANGRTIVSFDVRDDHSPIERVEYSRDGVEWQGVFPTDGIADSRLEHYELTVDGALDARGLTLRAMDAMNNVATAHVERAAP